MRDGKAPEISRSLGARFRRNTLLLASLVLYLLCVGIVLYQIDKAHFQSEKAEIVGRVINSDVNYFSRTSADQFKNAAFIYLQSLHNSSDFLLQERRRVEAETLLKEFMESSPIAIAATLESADGEVLMEQLEYSRLAVQNNFDNSLLFMNFERTLTAPIYQDSTNSAVRGYVRMRLTTPLDNQEIESLTIRYRWVALTSVTIISLLFLLILRGVLLPVRRVISYMDRPDLTISPVIPIPGSLLERAYNNLARDAAISRLSVELRSRVADDNLSLPEEVYRVIPTLAKRQRIEGLQIYTFTEHQSKGEWTFDHCFTLPIHSLNQEQFQRFLEERVNDNPPDEDESLWRESVLQFREELRSREPGSSEDQLYIRQRPWYCDIIEQSEGHIAVFVIHSLPPRFAPPTPWWADFHGRICREIRFGVQLVKNQKRLILQEKSKANISLSRNLGHDLTNIIATSKLELMTVRAFLSLTPEDIRNAPAKEKIFRESLEALLNNTRFLQEIVNLYRSYSYLQRPRFEETDISELVKDVAELFKLSLSKSFTIELELTDGIPKVRVEPRLLRLALFNLLTNAIDAIKLGSSAEKPEGSIHVSTSYNRDRNAAEVRIGDTGPGIRDENGELLGDDMIQQVFRLGYTTKKNQEGEGLGLNWVQTIVAEFHEGSVSATNRPEGGAQFCVSLPISENEETDPPGNTENGNGSTVQQIEETENLAR